MEPDTVSSHLGTEGLPSLDLGHCSWFPGLGETGIQDLRKD